MTGSRITITKGTTVTATTIGATHETGELSPGYNGQHSVWFAFTPTTTGTVTVSTAGSGFDTMLGFYVNSNGLLSGATQVSSDSDSDSCMLLPCYLV